MNNHAITSKTAKRRSTAASHIPRGKVLSLLRTNGEWLAVVASFTSKSSDPVLSSIVRVEDLKGSARRKADRWVQWLS